MLLAQQCDNNFRPENVPCNHLGDSQDRSRKRRDRTGHNDEVLTQSSGHLSFATRYNSRKKRNNNSSNELDNNNTNNMPIQKYTTKIDNKREDGYRNAEVAVENNDRYFNDINPCRVIKDEERDNQHSNKTRYAYLIFYLINHTKNLYIYIFFN